MKDFAEVMRQVFPDMNGGVYLPSIGMRHEERTDEVRRNQNYGKLQAAIARLETSGHLTQNTALFTMFMNGLICGLEMSKE